ncbi:MAG: transglutaminase-like domain-containing protein, partial [Actinomycetota bacterium]|nr:transglutaminase-like domain-containing protein [Actinomycetota bacterium]
GDWRYDRSTLDIISAADGQTAASLRYSLKALRIEPEPQGLAAAAPVSQELFSTYTALPDSMPDLVRDLARSVTEDQASRFEQAVRLQEWFRDDGGFTYSLDREAGNGIDELEQFLGNGPRGRIGYCEQFAAAMSLMGRSIGIPSRVAVGFLRPDRVRKNVYVYSAHDLHAWPEMYFEGTGWIRFEPTPPDRAGSVPGYTVRNVPAEAPSEQPSPLGPGQQQNRFGQQDLPESPQASAGGSSGGGLRGALIGVVGAAGLLLLAAAPRLARAAVRRRRWTRAGTPVELAEAAWSELRDTAIDLRLPWDDAVTLRSRARSLVQSFGEPSAEVDHRVSLSGASDADANQRATAALERLVKFVERARFARSVAAPKEDVVEDVGLCAQALRDGVSEGRRAYATWLPRSLANTFGAGLDRRRLPRAEGPILSGPGVDRAI